MLSDLPVSRSTRAASICTCTPPSGSSWRTAVHEYRSGARPAQATRSKSSSTASIWSFVGASSRCHAITPEVYLCLKSRLSATSPTMPGFPRSTVTPTRSTPDASFSSSRYSAAPAPLPVPCARNLIIIGNHHRRALPDSAACPVPARFAQGASDD